jgi:hypothetical protein
MNNRHLYLLSAALTAAGLLVFLYKVISLGFPLRPDVSAKAWEIEVKISFESYDRPAKVELQIPGSRPSLPIINENFISRGFGLTTARIDNHRLAIWSKRRAAGPQTLYYQALVELRSPLESGPGPSRRPEVDAPGLSDAELLAANAILDDARQKSADLDTLIAQLVRRFSSPNPNDEYASLLAGWRTGERGRQERIVQILALADTPARTIHGIRLYGDRGGASLVSWLEVHDGTSWRSYNESGAPDSMSDYLIFWRGAGRLVSLTGGDRLHIQITKEPVELEGLLAATSRERMFSPDLWAFSLHTLPLSTRNVFRVLLLVPVGVFMLVLMRNVVGVKTFGTFMPVLIALAFRETNLLTGILLFTFIVSLGLAVRFYLDRLQLLLVPRLAAVLIVVIIMMLMMSVVGNQLGIESGLSVALFPMVIITMTIERMSIVWEERGPAEAVQQGLGSLLTAALAFGAMSLPLVVHLFTTFPELLLVLLAVTLLLGRYSGYRLLELRRFRALVREQR